jgi:hypothetical protein
MPEEDNPFLIKKKPVNESEKAEGLTGFDDVSFMLSPEEAKKLQDRDQHLNDRKPHYEHAGTPIWDKKDVNIDNPDYEVVDHTKEEEDE